jgi:drug/metabolite transporter (DMT)-like permease
VLHEPFTRTQQICGWISLLGVILIARPVSLFSALKSSSPAPSTPPASGSSDVYPAANATAVSPFESHVHHPSPLQHVYAVLFALLGVMGASCAYTSIRWIGNRAHPLISVNYFSIWCTFVSSVCLAVIPSVNFRLPGNIIEWSLLLVLGASGFVMQFLLTAGLAYNPEAARADAARRLEIYAAGGDDSAHLEKTKSTGGSKATTMLYTNMLFALIFDKVIWGSSPTIISWAGSALILGSTMWVALKREPAGGATEPASGSKNEEEGRGLMEGNEAGEGSASQTRELRGWRDVELRTLR